MPNNGNQTLFQIQAVFTVSEGDSKKKKNAQTIVIDDRKAHSCVFLSSKYVFKTNTCYKHIHRLMYTNSRCAVF